MDRKQFLNTSLLFGTASLASFPNALADSHQASDLEFQLREIPNFCSHEHWGSLGVIGFKTEGFQNDLAPGSMPVRRVNLLDLILDPYMLTCYMGVDTNPLDFLYKDTKVSLPEMAITEPLQAFRLLEESLSAFYMRGTWLCQRLGFHFAYDCDLMNADDIGIHRLNREIGNNYNRLFSWYQDIMKKANLCGLIRAVQPEFYFADRSSASAQQELSFTRSLLRIDPFLDMWQKENPRRDFFADQTGIDPIDKKSWRKFLEVLFSKVEDTGCIGIKQLQAYSRSLDFGSAGETGVKCRGDLSENEIRHFQNFIMHECCRLASEKKWPHQIHTGTHNLPDSNPLPLEMIARTYPDQKIILLHTWPYYKEAGYLAQYYPNVFIDACWQQNLNPGFLRESLSNWLGYIPLNKLMISNDSTSVEMAVGSSIITRNILAEALTFQKKAAGLSDSILNKYAWGILHDNAEAIFG